MKDLVLKEKHLALGAKMVPFAGYEMPVQYTGVKDEHAAVRNKLGVFDVSHMGEFIVEGKQALQFIQHVTSNDVLKLRDGQVQYSCFPTENGGIVDDLLVYRFKENQFLLVVNASNIEKDFSWISQFARHFDVELRNVSDDYALIAVQGPNAVRVVNSLCSENLEEVPYYHFVIAQEFAGCPNVLVSATGYTGAGGVEIYLPNAIAGKVWDAVMDAGAEYGIQAAGLAARDTLRLEMGYCLYGNDIDDTTSPLEAGLSWICKLDTGFVGSEFLLAQKEEGVKRKLIGFELIDRGVPRNGYEVVDSEGAVIGRVTSGTMSPSLNKAVGMAYVPIDLSTVGSEIFIQVRSKQLKAIVVKTPFK